MSWRLVLAMPEVTSYERVLECMTSSVVVVAVAVMLQGPDYFQDRSESLFYSH